MNTIVKFFNNYVAWLTFPKISVVDIIEIFIIAYAFYHIILWIKDTRAWVLLKGMVLLALVFIVALILDMNVVLWAFENAMVVGIVAIVIIFQPELRGFLEKIGRNNILGGLGFDGSKGRKERYSQKSVAAIVKSTYDMASEKTGALIVVEREIQCKEYERTGISLDSKISSQLLTNIFEHNTPLHDGAVLLRDDRIVCATCYLPLSGVEISKELGTRHRAALGISEVSDSLTIVVSEETGSVSLACDGQIYRHIDADTLTVRLKEAAKITNKSSKKKKKGRQEDEEKVDE